MEIVKVEKQATSLREFTRLIISFLFCLFLLTLYQYIVLYSKGVVDSVFNISFLLAIVHNFGFSSLIGLLLVGPYYIMEIFKPTLGFKFAFALLNILLVIEGLLIVYYIQIFSPLSPYLLNENILIFFTSLSKSFKLFFSVVSLLILLGIFFAFAYRVTKKYYHRISKMFPLTIVFFTIFVATLFTEGKPINQNKTQVLAFSFFHNNKKTINKIKFTNEETVWINSQFNGKNFDNAYQTARELAYNKEPEKALLLIKFILSEIPSHIDAKILQGRINAWEGNYDTAITIFEECLVTNGGYDDIYNALLDVCFWSDNNDRVLTLIDKIEENNIKSDAVNKKVVRAYRELKKSAEASNTLITNPKMEAFIASLN